ncbi:MAG TPA: hypothetical protein VLT87_11070 [Thermoanaerobaculia bacterium]|nr:hypothetical protein [Thermoanaerobaculia bacterium]
MSDLTVRLLAQIAAAPLGALSDMDTRLCKLTLEFLREMVVLVRCDGAQSPEEVRGLTPDVVARATALAFRAAVEVEQPLREIRSRMEAR